MNSKKDSYKIVHGSGAMAKIHRREQFLRQIAGLSSVDVVQRASLIPNVSKSKFSVIKICP